jgi:sialic acid synthase SpsE
MEPLLLETILGRRVVRAIKADEPLSWDDFLQPG